MEELLRYFPDLSATQIERFTALGRLYNRTIKQFHMLTKI